jgi:hypothetical protein
LEKLENPDLRKRKFACLSFKAASLFSLDNHARLKKNALSIITAPLGCTTQPKYTPPPAPAGCAPATVHLSILKKT